MSVGAAGKADLLQHVVAEFADEGHRQPADPLACARSRSQTSRLFGGMSGCLAGRWILASVGRMRIITSGRQHALRAYTPEDAKALKATVSTFPKSGYDLAEVLTHLGIGEAVVTVLSERGAPTPVAWTMLPPRSLMAQLDPTVAGSAVQASPLLPRYGETIDRESAYERLAAKVLAKPDATPAPAPQREKAPRRKGDDSVLQKVLGSSAVRGMVRSAATAAGREIMRSIFSTARRRK